MGKIENAFIISGIRESFTVCAPNAKSCRDWVHCLSLAIEAARLKIPPDCRSSAGACIWEGLNVDVATQGEEPEFCDLRDVRMKHIKDSRIKFTVEHWTRAVKYKKSKRINPEQRLNGSVKEPPLLQRSGSAIACGYCGKEFGLLTSKAHCSQCGGLYHSSCTRRRRERLLDQSTDDEEEEHRVGHGAQHFRTSSKMGDRTLFERERVCLSCFWQGRRRNMQEAVEAQRLCKRDLPIIERLKLLTDHALQAQPKLIKLLGEKQEMLWVGDVEYEGKDRLGVVTRKNVYLIGNNLHHIKHTWSIKSILEAKKVASSKETNKIIKQKVRFESFSLSIVGNKQPLVLTSPLAKELANFLPAMAKDIAL